MAPQYPSTAHTQGVVYPMQSVGHYSGQNPGGGVPFGIPFAPSYPPYGLSQQGQHIGGAYPPFVANPSIQAMGTGHTPVYGAGYYPHPPYATPYGNETHPFAGQQRQDVFQARQGSRVPVANPGSSNRGDEKRAAEEEYDVSKTIVDGSNPMRLVQPALAPGKLISSRASEVLYSDTFCYYPDATPTSLAHSTSTTPSTPRGPPRRPKQSGHALWVGNLPPGANVMDLRDHFSQDATHDIESVFLISKSNCAFVNYKTAAACAAALARFHDSRFQGVRLVCRLRKGFTAPGSGFGAPGSRSQSRSEETTLSCDKHPVVSEARPAVAREEGARSLDRYFIVKSLTVEDLELSKQSGIWATQTHNETNLNHAFEVSAWRYLSSSLRLPDPETQTTEHVYLIFSANKSGEYFGYARMLSPINDDEELALEMPARPEPLPGGSDELDVTTTAETSTAPKGRIIDDSARGTIFWEVESSEEGDEVRSENSAEGRGEEPEPESQSFGKPFRIQWLSTERVPFHRTRGLRNPWNANREVKIARDGTEIEPTVGRKLVQLFHLA